jgi:cellulose synthase/poly-beta-1,6-N-acetylglucosamine synthase-like glycosyltransferase
MVLEILFWAAIALLGYTLLGYPLLLWMLARGRRPPAVPEPPQPPEVSLVVAAYDEEAVIARKVEDALALDYPRDRLELIVASDGSSDRTVERARAAGADLVLDLSRRGKIPAQDAAVENARGAIVAFSDANSLWARDALRWLVAPFADPAVGYVCGQVRFVADDGANEEGLYWRFEMVVRALESRLAGVTAGNGAIYAVRRDAYVVVDPRMGHDLSLPFKMVKRGLRAVYEQRARAVEKMAPTIEAEFRRKRRMMSRAWPTLLRGGMLSPRGYGPLYAIEIVSHRLLRYLAPFLHLLALGTNVALAGRSALYAFTLGLHLAFLLAAVLGRFVGQRLFRIPYYYVLVTASLAAGLWDTLRGRSPVGWEKVPGTR